LQDDIYCSSYSAAAYLDSIGLNRSKKVRTGACMPRSSAKQQLYAEVDPRSAFCVYGREAAATEAAAVGVDCTGCNHFIRVTAVLTSSH
jgi:hypothetical protein